MINKVFIQKTVNSVRNHSILTGLLLFSISMLSLSLNTVHADESQGVNIVRLSGENGAHGTAVVVNKKGPDDFLLVSYRLQPMTYYTVFLTESQTPGFLPAQFIGEFKTNERGFGTLSLNAEIVQAFASANQELADDQGIAAVRGAGAIANGANTIPLNWIRVYLAEGGGNVFGPSESEFGGGIVLTSQHPLP